jgi:hypothetical protein
MGILTGRKGHIKGKSGKGKERREKREERRNST